MAAFSCHPQIPSLPGLPNEELTVGRVFGLECEGPWGEAGDPRALRFETPDAQKYALRLLDAKSVSKDVIRFDVTSYTVGKVHFDALKVAAADGKTFDLGPLDFEVRSVLDPQQPKQEPYGPFGPLAIGIPGVWWVALGVIAAAVVVGIGLWWRRSAQRRHLLRRLSEHDSATTPAAEFHQRLRRLRREKALFSSAAETEGEPAEVVRELNDMFRIFFMRRFRLPAFEWSDRTLSRQFRREHARIAEETGDAVAKLLREFAAARAAARVAPTDAIQLAETSRALVEKLDRLVEKGGA